MKLFSQEADNLEYELREAAQAYYTNGSSKLTDAEFDAKLQRLKILRPQSEILTAVGHGYTVQRDDTAGNKYKHKYGPAGSLPKLHNWDERIKTINHDDVIASLKIDGLSVVLYYEHSKLIRALTRGDGYTGIDITDKIRCIMDQNVDCKFHCIAFTGAIRAEIVMSLSAFDDYCKSHPEATNPRNTAAGLINAKELSPDLKYLDIIAYTVVGVENNLAVNTYLDLLNFLKCFPYKLVKYEPAKLTECSIDNVMLTLREKWYGDVPSDGIVIADNRVTTKKLSENVISITYNSEAFKFPAEMKQTTVEAVVWALSKTGYLIPRVQVEPITLSGATVRYASGFNAKYIADNTIGAGAIVELMRSGEVIPDIQRIVMSAPAGSDLPKHCPECQSELVWDGVHLKCPNPNCRNQAIQDLLIWSNVLSPLDNLGDSLRIKFFTQIFGPDVNIDEVMTNTDTDLTVIGKGAQAKLFSAMLDKIYDRKNIPIATALRALNIPRLGDKTADKFASDAKLIVEILEEANRYLTVTDASRTKLCKCIGDANASAVLNNLNKFARLNYIFNRICWTISNDAPSKGQVCITGKLSCKRADFIALLAQHGYSAGDLTMHTMFLITDEPDSGSSKNQKADKLGIPKITEHEFRQKYLN